MDIEEKNNDYKIDKACKRYKRVYHSKQAKFNTLDKWLDKESKIFIKELEPTSKTYKKFFRGQIIKVDFGINIGSELCYTHFAIVITKRDSINSNILTVVPITSKKGDFRIKLGKILHIAHPNSKKYNLDCYANLSQITTISKCRIFPESKNYICEDAILDIIDNSIMELYTKCKNL